MPSKHPVAAGICGLKRQRRGPEDRDRYGPDLHPESIRLALQICALSPTKQTYHYKGGFVGAFRWDARDIILKHPVALGICGLKRQRRGPTDKDSYGPD